MEKPNPARADRRHERRIPVQLPAKLEFYRNDMMKVPPSLGGDEVNESTGKLVWMAAEVEAISRAGATVQIFNLARDKYFRIVRGQAKVYVYLHLRFPPTNERTRLFGVVRWSDFHATLTDVTNLGVEFQELLPHDAARLEAYIAELARISPEPSAANANGS